MNAFGPHDEYEATEIEPEANQFLTAISSTLAYCEDQDVAHACSVSETWINTCDYHADGVADYGLETMFGHPDLKRELELQHAFMASLEAQ